MKINKKRKYQSPNPILGKVSTGFCFWLVTSKVGTTGYK